VAACSIVTVVDAARAGGGRAGREATRRSEGNE
jgi:hypothetical protein